MFGHGLLVHTVEELIFDSFEDSFFSMFFKLEGDFFCLSAFWNTARHEQFMI